MEKIHIICFIAGLLGIIIHILVKIKSLQVKAKAGNAPFSLREYFSNDLVAIILSNVVVIASVFALGDQGVQNYDHWYANWPRLIFIAIGYSANDLATRFFGATSAKINKIIDIKTNIADGKSPE